VNDLKNGIVAGVIAGIIAGIVGVLYSFVYLGLPLAALNDPWWAIQIGINTIWGGLFGFMYQRFHDLIPGKGVVKGVAFGFILWLVHAIYPATFIMAFWAQVPELTAFGTTMALGGFIVRVIAYGISIGFLFKK
jgi:hypothetical protein